MQSGVIMGLEGTWQARMTVLNQEIDFIHHANRLFWEQKKAHGRKAKGEYYCRQDRLEEIRSEMAELSDVGGWC
jgi:hypothetical protein